VSQHNYHCTYRFHRLNLPGNVEEGENSSAKYHVESHSFVIILDKITPGEMFPNLDMMTAMLQPKPDLASASSPLIEIMSSKLQVHSPAAESIICENSL